MPSHGCAWLTSALPLPIVRSQKWIKWGPKAEISVRLVSKALKGSGHAKSAKGHKRTFCSAIVMSALPPKADISVEFNRFLGAGAVPVVSISFALWGAPASTVHPADLPPSHRGRAAVLSRAL